MNERIGLVGVGLLGSAIAERLMAASFEVLGFDRQAERLGWLSAHGGQASASLRPIGESCRLILLSLPDSHTVRQVVSDLGDSLQPRALILDTTTGSPEDAERLATELAARQIDYAEVTIAGSSEQVRQCRALAMVGASATLWPRIAQVTRCFAEHAIHVGGPGQAGRMKLAVNLVLGLHRAVLAEGLAFAKSLGLDEALTLDVMKSSPAYSAVMDTKGPKMLSGDYTPQARLAQHLKDVQLMIQQAQHRRIALPLTAVHRTLLEKAVELGLSELDNSAIRRVFQSAESDSS